MPEMSADDIYNVIPVIPYEDTPVHTADTPFCDDPTCPCHSDGTEESEQLTGYYQDGLVTGSEADTIFHGYGQL